TRRNIGERRKESVVGRGTLYSEPKVDREHGLSKPFDDRFGLRWNLIWHDGNSLCGATGHSTTCLNLVQSVARYGCEIPMAFAAWGRPLGSCAPASTAEGSAKMLTPAADDAE